VLEKAFATDFIIPVNKDYQFFLPYLHLATAFIIIIIITRLTTHVKVIHRVKNRKCGKSRISEGKLGCKVQSLPIV